MGRLLYLIFAAVIGTAAGFAPDELWRQWFWQSSYAVYVVVREGRELLQKFAAWIPADHLDGADQRLAQFAGSRLFRVGIVMIGVTAATGLIPISDDIGEMAWRRIRALWLAAFSMGIGGGLTLVGLAALRVFGIEI